MKSLIVALLACGLLGAADDDKTKADKKALLGDWKQVSMEFEGESKDDDSVTVTFKDDEITVDHKGNAEPAAKYKIDASKDPKTIDITTTVQENRKLLGIYKLKDDDKTLTVCFNDEKRPTEFSTKAGSKSRLVVLKRK